MLRACALALILAGPAFAATPTFTAPGGRWKPMKAASGEKLFRLGNKALISVGEAEPSGDAAEFQQQVSQSGAADLSDRGEVQRFTHPDGRQVVSLDGQGEGRRVVRRCWLFENGQRVKVELSAVDAQAFHRAEAQFMSLLASIHLAAEPSTPPVHVAAGEAQAPVHLGAASAGSVDATLQYTVPPGWKRIDAQNAVWLEAPGGIAGKTYVMLTPAERIGGDFEGWYARRTAPSPELQVVSKGALLRNDLPGADQSFRQRLTLRVRGAEVHQQEVVAEHIGHSAVVVALDAPNLAALAAHGAAFARLLESLSIKGETRAAAPTHVEASAPGNSAAPVHVQPTALGAYPSFAAQGWSLASDDAHWRTYKSGAAKMLVSRATHANNPAQSLNAMRASMGFINAYTPEQFPLGNGTRMLRIVDAPRGAAPATETVLLVGDGKQVFFVLSAGSMGALNGSREAFERLLSSVEL